MTAAPIDAGGRPPLTFDLSVVVHRPPSDVFMVLADIQDHEPIPRDAHVRMTKHPPTATRVGTRWNEKVRIAPGCWISIESVVTDLEGPGVLGMDFRSLWFSGHLTYTLEPSAHGTTLRQREHLRPRWPLRWFPRRVDRTLRAQLLKRLAQIRDILEGTTDAALDPRRSASR